MLSEQNESPSLQPLPRQQMHKIVFSLMGVFALVALSYPLAMFRVSRMEKFRDFGLHLQPLTPEYQAVYPIKTTSQK